MNRRVLEHSQRTASTRCSLQQKLIPVSCLSCRACACGKRPGGLRVSLGLTLGRIQSAIEHLSWQSH
eukprot:2152540-Prymnesium_polylepis.1